MRRLPRSRGRLRAAHRGERSSSRVVIPVVFLAAIACSVTTPTLHGPDQLPPPAATPLKAHLHSGELIVFEAWQEDVAGRRLVGTGRRYDRDRNAVSPTTDVQVPVDSVALVEVSQRGTDTRRGLGLTLLAGYTILSGSVAAICVADPKSCFGSCPTFYLDAEGGERLVAEGFSSSVARALEATDLDDIRWTSADEPFSIRMRNEALETHAVRSLRLHAVPERPGQRVFATADGRFRAATRMIEPIGCTASEGDCLPAVQALDGRDRRSVTDPADLAARETIELEFPPNTTAAGIVIGARHAFVSTFLFYQMLAYLGRDAGAFLASVERGEGDLVPRIKQAMRRLGGIDVSVLTPEGEWRQAASFEEAGPLATDLHLLELPGPADSTAEGPLRVRLDLTQGFWRIDYVALAELGETVEATVFSPVAVERVGTYGPSETETSTTAPDALESLLDPDRYLVTEPGDHFRIVFDLDGAKAHDRAADHDGPGRQDHRLFLESTGYYYEWMRDEWLREESPVHAAMMLYQPDDMFRELAPTFKELEADMEASFWNSRFRR